MNNIKSYNEYIKLNESLLPIIIPVLFTVIGSILYIKLDEDDKIVDFLNNLPFYFDAKKAIRMLNKYDDNELKVKFAVLYNFFKNNKNELKNNQVLRNELSNMVDELNNYIKTILNEKDLKFWKYIEYGLTNSYKDMLYSKGKKIDKKYPQIRAANDFGLI